MKTTKACYLTKVANELSHQSQMPVGTTSALLNMLVKSVVNGREIYPNSSDRMIDCLARYYHNRVYAYVPMQRSIAQFIMTDAYIRTAVKQSFQDDCITAINARQVIKSSLSLIANTLLIQAAEQKEYTNA